MMKKILLVTLFAALSGSISIAQNIGGIGAQLFLDTAGGHTMPRIQALVPNSPAYQYLNATDYIIKVNGVSCGDKTMEEVVAMIRGEAGTTVKITVADTKEGKRAKDVDLQRVGLTLPPGSTPPPPDPLTSFTAFCDNEVRQLKHAHMEIVKTFSSECGDFFFNFNAESGQYHVRVMTMEQKGSVAYAPAFNVTAKVFDGDNEAAAVQLGKAAPKDGGNFESAQIEGTISFKKACVGTIAVSIHSDVKKCAGMYIIVYK
jgi:PDZ domain-containing protein